MLTLKAIKQKAQDNVERGAELLDEKEPGWWKEIEEERLKMRNCDKCVLGRVYGDYYKGKAKLGMAGSIEEPRIYGFDMDVTMEAPGKLVWQALDELWLQEIERRKKPAGDSLPQGELTIEPTKRKAD